MAYEPMPYSAEKFLQGVVIFRKTDLPTIGR